MFPEGTILEVARLAGLELKRRSNDEYVVRCPRPQNHRNGDEHPSCRLNVVKNTWFCDPCGCGGGVVDFAEMLNVDLQRLSAPALRVHSPKKERKRRPLVFVSSSTISDDAQRHFAESLAKSYAADTWAAFGVLEGAVHPEGLPDKSEDAIGFPLPSGGLHIYRYRRRNKKQRWCFANGGKADLIIAGLDRSDPVILAEGEWDAMRAYELGYAATTGTGAGTFRVEWGQLFAGRRVAVVYDVDHAGRTGSEKAIHGLGSSPKAAWDVRLPLSGNDDADGKDLCDFVAVYGPDAFKAVVLDTSTPETEASTSGDDCGLAGLETAKPSVARAIDAVLSVQGPARLKRREAAHLVIEDLTKCGELIQATGGRQFWFQKETRQLVELDGFPFRSFLISEYEINPAETEFRHVVESIRAYTRRAGRAVTVYRFSYYDRDLNRLYLSAGAGRVVRLDGQDVSWINHGDDGVLFEGYQDFNVIPDGADEIHPETDALHEFILGRVNFVRGSGVILSPDQQRLILRVWALAIFFPELLPAKALLLLYGEKGSGKTTTLRVLLKLLLGPAANVTPLAKEDGFNATVSNEYLIALDNVDSYCRWIEDRLATVATGQEIRLRKLYTTNEMITYPSRCAIALTARTPRFRRDDVVDRLQILRVARLEKFSSEADWYGEIEAHRSTLWAQLLRDLNAVVAQLGEERVEAPDSTRMADWAFLATTIGVVLGQEEAIRAALEASELDKAQFLLEADELYDLLFAVANDQPDRAWKAGELYAELNRRAEKDDIEFKVKSPRSLGRILHRLEPALKMMIRFEIDTNSHDRQASYLLGPLADEGDAAE